MSTGFYLTIPSNGSISQKEFPRNTNNSWKIRLLQPINLEGKWKVGLSSISYPSDSRLNQYLKSLTDDTLLLQTKRLISKGSDSKTYYKVIQTITYSVIKEREILSVKDLLEALFEEEWLQFIIQLGKDSYVARKLSDGTIADYQFKVKTGEDLISLDTTEIYQKDVKVVNEIEVTFQENLLRTFGFVEDQEISISNSKFTALRPGPNLNVRFRSDSQGWSEDISKRRSEGWFYGMQKIPNDYFSGGGVRLRMDSSWTFTNLRYQSHTKGTESRSLYVYSSLCEPQIMGSDTSDLLRQVVYNPSLKGGYLYEPHNIQYVGLRQNRIEVIETEIGEVDEDSLAKFHKGNTTITVHFKKVP